MILKIIEDSEREFDGIYNYDGCGKALVVIEDDEGGISQTPAQNEIKSFIRQQQRALLEGIVKLSDTIESADRTGHEEWRAFKGLRNTLRDIIKQLEV